jgi:PadR family transcriptional regulator, regulatory protein PadR
VLILKAVSLGSQHGYGLLLRIQQMSNGTLAIEQGALYPALFRLEHQGLVRGEWGKSENGRRAKFYSLTATGRRRLEQDLEGWSRMVEAMGLVLGARALEVGS